MSPATLSNLFIFTGIALIALAIPAVHEKTIEPLQRRGFLPAPPRNPKEYEIIKNMGPRLSLITLGVLFILIGIFVRVYGQ